MCQHHFRPSDLYKIAKQSNCLRLQVAAYGKDSKGNIFIGWNHMSDGSACEVNPNLSKPDVKHAEIHLLEQSDDIVYVSVTHSPCLECSKALFEAGVHTVEYIEDYRIPDGVNWLASVGVKVIKINTSYVDPNIKPIINLEDI